MYINNFNGFHGGLEMRELANFEEWFNFYREVGMQPVITPGEKTVDCSLCHSVTDQNFVSWSIEQGRSLGLDSLEHDIITIQRKKTSSSLYGPPTYMVNNSCINFEAVAQDATYVNLDNSAKEIIGPKETISGHPLIVINNIHDLGYVSVHNITMLYRRFFNELTDTASNGTSIHSIQWLPTYAGEDNEC